MRDENVRSDEQITHDLMVNEACEELLCDLMELPPEERIAALEAMDGFSGESKAKVRRMLELADDADAYFTGMSAAVKMLPPTTQVEGAGDMCGPYKLIRKLGEGGFGLVWLAEQEKPLRRTVAVKVIKAGMDTAEVLARFDAEKHALSRMDHPHIAKALDAGMTEHGRPYFVMELTEGKSITRYCQENGVAIQQRLRLFGDVCSALQHAHQKGIIHRDIKPSNVIVTEIESKPVVKVIDFGIAKAIEGNLTDHTLFTRVEQWIGTPAYMSPEQAGLAPGDVDTRSDIYALGVLLYELITGVAPFDVTTLMKAGHEEMRRIIREEEPPKPSVRITTANREARSTDDGAVDAKTTTAKGVSSELDWIVMKAMEKAKERRYESASALAGDVTRYLSDEPIEARPPSSLYMLGKFARRHRLGIHIASGFLALIVGAVLLSVWLALRAQDAEQIAREQLAAAIEDRNAKNEALEEAEAVGRLLADVLQRPQQGMDGRKVTVLEALDAAVGKLDVQLQTQPQRLAMLRGVLADTYERLGIFDRAFDLREKNFETYRELSGLSHHVTRMALRKLIEAAEAIGDSAAALRYAQLESEILREANAANQEIESSMRSVVLGWFGVGEREKAIDHQRELVTFCARAFGEGSRTYATAMWELRQYEASMHGTPGEPSDSEAASSHLAGITAMEKDFATLLEAHGALHSDTIEARTNLVKALISAGHIIEAMIHLQALRTHTVEVFGLEDNRTIWAHESLVRVYVRLSRMNDAVRVQQVVVNTLRERDGGLAPSTVRAEDHLERRLFYSDLERELFEYRRDLVERRIQLFGEDHVNTVLHRIELGAKSREEREQHIEIAIRVLRENQGSESRSLAEVIGILARRRFAQGKVAEAIRLYAECAPNMCDDTYINFECATLQLWTGDAEGYRTTRRNLIDDWKQYVPSQRSQPFQFDRMLLISSLAKLEDDEEQKDALRRILDHVENIRDGLHMEAKDRHSKVYQNQIKGAVLYRLGMLDESLAAFDESARLSNPAEAELPGIDYQRQPQWVCFLLAMIQHRKGNPDQATRWFESGEARLEWEIPCEENPRIPYFLGGEKLIRFILHREAKAMIFGE